MLYSRCAVFPIFERRAAINIATNRRKTQNYSVSAAEIDALLDIREDARDPAVVMEVCPGIEAFKRALAELPERPREVLRRMSIEGNTTHEVAKQLKVSVFTVEGDLKQALKHCSRVLAARDADGAAAGLPRSREVKSAALC
jgi:RNA polymerase sigma-70 factor, ECF subfamily